MAKKEMDIDFSEVENIKFTCFEYCGKCCFYQAAFVTTTEINRIRNFLDTKSPEDFEAFTLDRLTFLNRLPEVNNELIKALNKTLQWFWTPFQLQEAEEGILVRNYMIHSMPSTGRCMFLNPMNFKCFIYPVRPNTCRLYPFTSKINEARKWSIVVAMKNCPGIGIGRPLNRKEIKENVQSGTDAMMKEVEMYERYVSKKGIKRIMRKIKKQRTSDINAEIMKYEESWRGQYFFGKKGDLESVLAKKPKFIEPFAELGIIPSHPFLHDKG